MEKMLLISQEETDTWFVSGISIGVRNPRVIVGTKIKELLEKENTDIEVFKKDMGTNYGSELEKVLNNEAIPKIKLFDKIYNYFNLDKEYFYDKGLKNVIVNDSRMIVAEYETEARTLEVKKELDEYITDCYAHNLPIIIRMPKE
jgi:transcriptional regulator with XRE-family HTH domain